MGQGEPGRIPPWQWGGRRDIWEEGWTCSQSPQDQSQGSVFLNTLRAQPHVNEFILHPLAKGILAYSILGQLQKDASLLVLGCLSILHTGLRWLKGGGVYPIFTAALFTIAKTRTQRKCPSTDKKRQYIYVMEYCSAIKKNDAICSHMDGLRHDHAKWSHKEKDGYHMTSLIFGI